MNWIDIDYEIRAFLHGDKWTKPQGHLAVLRWFHIGEYSKFWDPEAKRAIGGPKWKYTDYVIRTVALPRDLFSGLMAGWRSTELPGYIDTEKRTYLIEKCYRPKIGDLILEYENCDPPADPDEFVTWVKSQHATPYRINNANGIRVDDNKVKYYLCDVTLENQER